MVKLKAFLKANDEALHDGQFILLYLQINETEFMYFIIAPSSTFSLVNLRNRTGEERRRQSLCDKRDNNFVWNNFFPNFTFL